VTSRNSQSEIFRFRDSRASTGLRPAPHGGTATATGANCIPRQISVDNELWSIPRLFGSADFRRSF
jgi:hypothetical protein